MPTRKLENYIGINTKGAQSNLRLTQLSKQGIEKKLPVTLAHKIADFFSNNVIQWILHNAIIKRQYKNYPAVTERSIHTAKNAHGSANPIIIGVAADWASGTIQAEYIADKMLNKNPCYTIHMGDTYYSGAKGELENNFGNNSGNPGIWKRGKVGTFALAGNHEMFSSGTNYLNMITAIDRGLFGFGEFDTAKQIYPGQEAPCFCIRTSHWCILGLDTGYNSLKQGFFQRIFDSKPDNTKLELPANIMSWLEDVVKLKEEKRGIIVLTHHQYISAFNGEQEFPNPLDQDDQLKKLLSNGREIIWIWGHEHRFSMYGKYQKSPDSISVYGRCIGNGGMADEHTDKRFVDTKLAASRNLVLYDHRIAKTYVLSPKKNLELGFNCYCTITLNNERATLSYYAGYQDEPDNGTESKIIEETWKADNTNGKIKCINVIDATIGHNGSTQLNYFGNEDANRVGR